MRQLFGKVLLLTIRSIILIGLLLSQAACLCIRPISIEDIETMKLTFENRQYWQMIEQHCVVLRIPIPNGFEASSPSHAKCSVRISPINEESRGSSGLVVSQFSPLHPRIEHARTSHEYKRLQVGKVIWLIRSRVSLEDGIEEGFEIMLIGRDVTVNVRGANLDWEADAITDFLSRIELKESFLENLDPICK